MAVCTEISLHCLAYNLRLDNYQQIILLQVHSEPTLIE
jgi:hypothetical protein